ncbi:hypothetical protein BAOM_3036 [Peribacillus asahii]|uniref:Uncharacterized protein n=1 Tax=Peribacillus asahii TaxID=228899 RepID=A0A3Q9RPB7_9BACI|nr:hypothetical protein [Peribacillus asahii]AZV43645.1 hypothetical protein BAOM_3036 [Peribacillus asahii]
MLNIIGITLGFLGSLISVFGIISKPNKKESTYDDVKNSWITENINKFYTIIGLCFIAVGFLLQLTSEIIKFK